MTTFKELQKMRKLSTKADYIKTCKELNISISNSMKKNEIEKILDDVNVFSNILTNDEKKRLEYKKNHNKKEKQKIIDAPQVYICPASNKNMKISILNKFNGVNSWAYNSNASPKCNFLQKWNNMEIGSLCVFGSKKHGYTKAAYVIEKKNLNTQEKDWPFKGIDNKKDWSYGFILSEPFDINISKETIQENIKQKTWQTQILLDEKCANNLKKILML